VIVGSALGNLADRARIGAVIDFIDPAFWPAFNVADIGIVVGILGLFYVLEARDRGPRTADRGA
jgi:lipoprotein signal peptidase